MTFWLLLCLFFSFIYSHIILSFSFFYVIFCSLCCFFFFFYFFYLYILYVLLKTKTKTALVHTKTHTFTTCFLLQRSSDPIWSCTIYTHMGLLNVIVIVFFFIIGDWSSYVIVIFGDFLKLCFFSLLGKNTKPLPWVTKCFLLIYTLSLFF